MSELTKQDMARRMIYDRVATLVIGKHPSKVEVVGLFSPHVVEGYPKPVMLVAEYVRKTLRQAVKEAIEHVYGDNPLPSEIQAIIERVEAL